MSPSITNALTGFVPQLLPEVVLGLMACVLFLGGTWKASRALWGGIALLGLALAAVALVYTARTVNTVEAVRAGLETLGGTGRAAAEEALRATVYAAPVQFTRLALFFKVLALVGAAVFVLFSWDEPPVEQAAEYHGCLLLLTSGVCLTASANELITLFLALELVSIPTYVMLYLPRIDAQAQEAAMKYFFLSIFSSALLLFGFSYLYGVTGTTNMPAIIDALTHARAELIESADRTRSAAPAWQGLTLVALVMVVAGLGFRITAVPFHFYAPDVYQGTTTGMAALLAFFPKVVGFVALFRVLGFVPAAVSWGGTVGQALGEQVPVLLWIMAAVTMSLGNVLALLQDNIRRMLAYSSVAHAGYMLIGLAVAPRLAGAPGELVGGVEAVVFYLVAYGAMTVGAFAVIHHLSGAGRRVETVDDLAGLGTTHPGMALLMLVFLFSLIGLPLTAGFIGKFFLFFSAMGLNPLPEGAGITDTIRQQVQEQVRLYRILAVIAAVNAAVGSWYYLRIAAAMYLREAIEPLPRPRWAPVLGAIWVCALATLTLGVYPAPLVNVIQSSLPTRAGEVKVSAAAAPAERVARR